MVQEEVFAPEEEYEPMGHNPDTAVKPETLQNLPGLQAVQLHASDAFWNVPAGHCMQVGVCPVQCEPAGHDR